ncbi:MAG: alpha/beta hydrolase [Acetobacteraceae bacterium]|jgi:acetyl esterase/lipase
MPLDPHVQRFLRVLAATHPVDPSRLTVRQRRDGFRDLMRFSEVAPPIAGVEDRSLPGPDGPIRIRVYTPPSLSGARLPGLLWFHGGGLVAGSVETHDILCRVLAHDIGCRLVSVEYRLAPEHKFPAAVMDCLAATTWVIDNAVALQIAADRIAVGGDSAGGGLAAIVCQLVRQSRGETLAWQLLLCPILDYAGTTGSRLAFADDRLVSKTMMDHDLGLYLPTGVAPDDPRISPLRAKDVSLLPPAYIHTAEFDPMRDEGRAYADRLAAAGVGVAYTCHPGMIHLFYALTRVIPYGLPAMQRLGAELRASSNGH